MKEEDFLFKTLSNEELKKVEVPTKEEIKEALRKWEIASKKPKFIRFKRI